MSHRLSKLKQLMHQEECMRASGIKYIEAGRKYVSVLARKCYHLRLGIAYQEQHLKNVINHDDAELNFLQSIDEDGCIQLALTDMDSADLNSWLVNNNVPVKELIVRRSSLSKLFKKLTSEPDK